MDQRPALRIAGDDKTGVHVTWGRSGKRAIVTIGDRQAVLTVEQAAELGRFLSDGPDPSPGG